MRWNSEYDRCLWCGTVDIKYKANGLCRKCYYAFYNAKYEKGHIAVCSICDEIRAISTRKNNEVICKRCYKKHFFKTKKRKCYFCSRLGRIDMKIGMIDVCRNCYDKIKPRPKRLCVRCNGFEESYLKKDNGFICKYCYNRITTKKKRLCAKCNKFAKISKIFEEGPFCHRCYKKRRRVHYNALNHARQARKLGNGGNISEKEIKIIFERDVGCVYCKSKKQLTLDHVVPLSKKGKSDFSNMVLACNRCNILKRDIDVLDWCNRQPNRLTK